MIEGIMTDDLSGVINGEIENIKSAFPGDHKLSPEQNEVYQASGYKRDKSEHPLGETQPEPQPEEPEETEDTTGSVDETEETETEDTTGSTEETEETEETDNEEGKPIPDRPGSAENSGS